MSASLQLAPMAGPWRSVSWSLLADVELQKITTQHRKKCCILSWPKTYMLSFGIYRIKKITRQFSHFWIHLDKLLNRVTSNHVGCLQNSTKHITWFTYCRCSWCTTQKRQYQLYTLLLLGLFLAGQGYTLCLGWTIRLNRKKPRCDMLECHEGVPMTSIIVSCSKVLSVLL